MQVILKLLLSRWKEILLAILVASVIAFTYNTIYDRGANQANQEWQEKITAMEEVRKEQIAGIEQLSKTTIEQTLIANERIANDLKTLRNAISSKQLTTPDCKPTKDFVEIYNQAISRGNIK